MQVSYHYHVVCVVNHEVKFENQGILARMDPLRLGGSENLAVSLNNSKGRPIGELDQAGTQDVRS